MTEPYLGEIRLFAGNFAPRNNAYCSGQLISIQQNAALFSLLGTAYGGNGSTTFALPDFRGRIPVSMGQGPGLSNYTLGEVEGTESVTITTSTMPMHTHPLMASTTPANAPSPGGNIFSALGAPWARFWVSDANKTPPPSQLNAAAITMTGGNQPHENRMQSTAISIIIALAGVFPSRN